MKYLLISVGGQPEPIVLSIRKIEPDKVFFVVSLESLENTLARVKDELEFLGNLPENESVVVSDPEDLDSCYLVLYDLVQRIASEAPEAEKCADYTGGTKSLSSALVLATAGNGYTYNYVGGTKREGRGTGQVLSSYEKMRGSLDPINKYAIETKKRFALYFNNYQYQAAQDISLALNEEAESGERLVFEALHDITQGYELWDSFNHKGAMGLLRKGSDRLRDYLKLRPDETLAEFLQGIDHSLVFIKSLQDESNNFKSERPTHAMVQDLMANADRRAQQGKFDDAIARLYRLVEMLAQIAFEESFGCSTGKVDPGKLPPNVVKEFPDLEVGGDSAKFGLQETFRALSLHGHELGLGFAASDRLAKHIRLRNESILAHGHRALTKDDYYNLREGVQQLRTIEELPEFPALDWS